jgi:hypothetical protein
MDQDVHTADNINRLYNTSTNTHLISSNRYEINLSISNGWINEGVFGCAPRDATAEIFRFYVTSERRHFYTALEHERDLITGNQDLTDDGWTYEGVAFSAYSVSHHPEDAVAVFRYYNQETDYHLYSTSSYEQDLFSQDSNWINEGIAWYGDALTTINGLD